MARTVVEVVAAEELPDDAGVSELDAEDDVDDESVAAVELTCID